MTVVPAPGDRVELVRMVDDLDPIPAGSTGTVTRVREHDLGDGAWAQVSVDWDSGRRLMLTVPPDVVRVVGPAAVPDRA